MKKRKNLIKNEKNSVVITILNFIINILRTWLSKYKWAIALISILTYVVTNYDAFWSAINFVLDLFRIF